MSVLSIAQDILIVVKAVQMIVVEIKGNKNKAARLVNRINTIIPTIYMITQDPSKVICTVERLQDLLSYIQGIKAFIEKFNNTSYFGKAFHIGSDNLAFAEFNDGLGVRIEALQFNIQVNAEKQRQEDQQDAEADADELKSLVQQVLQSQGVMQAEINESLNNLALQNRQMFMEQNSAIVQGNAEILKAINSLQNGQFNNLPAIRTIAPEQLDYMEDDSSLMGQGGFGAIYRGTYLGMEVAIKTIKNQNITRAMKEELQKEALTMQMLDFPGIIHFYGANLEAAPRFIVMELAMCSLFDLLYNPDKYTPNVDFNLYARLDLLGDIARSIEYIHSVSIVHGDIKSHNILLSSDLKPKITDFGLSKGKGVNDVCNVANSDGTMDFKGSPAYLAPEIFLESSYSKFSDVYSFAVVMNEVLSRKIPFDRMTAEDIMHRTVTTKTRPALFTMEDLVACIPRGYPLDPNVMSESQALITRGWAEIASQRPLFHIMSKSLERIAGTIRGGGGMTSLDGGSSKNNKSFSLGSKTPKSDPGDAAKEAACKELASWLEKKVELFPDSAQTIAKTLVGAGVSSVNKLEARIKKIPKFLDSIGVAEFEAADILTALEKEMHHTSSSEPVTPSKPKRVSSAQPKNDPNYERKLMMKARECTSVVAIVDVLTSVMQIEPLMDIHKDTLREIFKVVTNLGFNNAVFTADLGKLGACVMITTLLYAYHDGLENANNTRNGTHNFDAAVIESGLCCIYVLATNNKDNQKALGEAGACALIVALLNRHGSSNPQIAEQALRAIEHLTLDEGNREKFGQQGICQLLAGVLGMYCTVNNTIVEHCLAAVSNLTLNSKLNQTNFMRANIAPPLMNAIAVMGPSIITVADYGMYTIRSLCLDNYDIIIAFTQYDAVNTILKLLYTHGSHSVTATESALGALSVLCCEDVPVMGPQNQPNPHLHIFYNNDQAIQMVDNAIRSYSSKSKSATISGFRLYNGLLNYMIAFCGNPYAQGAILVQPKVASDAKLRDYVMSVVHGIKTHGVQHHFLAHQAIILLKTITRITVAVNCLAVYSCFGEVNICAIVVDIYFTHRTNPVIVGHAFDMLIGLCGVPDNVVRLTTGPNGTLFKNILTTVGGLYESNNCPMALMETGIRLYTTLYSHLPATEANNGDPQGCRLLVSLLAKIYQHCFDQQNTVPMAGVTPIMILQGILQTFRVITAFPSNRATIGEIDGCRLLCDIGRSFSSDAGFSAVILEILANLAMLNTNEPKLIQAGVNKLAMDLLISYGYTNDVATNHGLRVIANLAIQNKLMLGQMNICPVVVDIIRFYVSKNHPQMNLICMQASVAVHNLAARCPDNKQIFTQLNVIKDLEALIKVRTVTDQTRNEAKDAINAIRFE